MVMDAISFRHEGLRQLWDRSTYNTLSGDPTKLYKCVLYNLIQEGVYLRIFSINKAETLIPDQPAVPTFHHLPKAQKGLNPLKGRPIVAGSGSLNERLGQWWLDAQLQPLVRFFPSPQFN